MSELVKEIVAVDRVLESHAGELGADFTAYRNHVYRVVNFGAAFFPSSVNFEKLAIAATFHDLGIWTDHTFDYLPPSCKLAAVYLTDNSHEDWSPEILLSIEQHHKITRYRGEHELLVEALRRADLADVSQGLFKFGLSRELVQKAYSLWPSAGFHRRLVQLELKHLVRHPLNPLPMLQF